MSDTSIMTFSADTVPDLFAAIDGGHTDRVALFVHDDLELVFGNSEPAHGMDGFTDVLTHFMTLIKAMRHEIHHVWSADGGKVVIAAMTVHYTRMDDAIVSVPCCNVFHVDGGRIRHYQVYVDAGPVLA